MKKILKEYDKLIKLTKTDDDWKSIDISRLNIEKFLKKNINDFKIQATNLKDLLFEEEKNKEQLILENNILIKEIKNNNIIVKYDNKKLLNIKNNYDINQRIKNLNYLFSPYFINIFIKNNTKQTQYLIINNIINPKFENTYHQKNVIKIGDNCNISIIERFYYLGEYKYISNIYSDIYVGKNSIVNYYCIKESYKNSIQIFHQNSYLQKNSKINYFIFSYGSGIQYIKKRCNLLNLDSKVEINGINYTNKKEKRSINFNTNHFIKNCYSNINTKGIFNSVKEGSIIGKINVKKNCFNTKAFFHSDNLLTISKAKVNIRPILKIYNRDVICNHGATIGYLGKEEIFYLQSRGVNFKDAQQILKHSFIKPSIDLIKIKEIKNIVKKILGITGIYI